MRTSVTLTTMLTASVLPISALSDPPVIKSAAPVIHVADNLDE
ncbi:MAG: hypothetical protein AAGF71_13595 [Pseudomonadota bacterium]